MAPETRNGEENREDESSFGYLIVNPEKCGIRDLLRLLLVSSDGSGIARFVESSSEDELGPINGDQRWVIIVSIIARKILAALGKPMEWTGYIVDFVLNLLSENGELPGLIYNLIRGKVVFPRRNSDTFISIVGHLDHRVDLLYNKTHPLTRHGESVDGAIQIGDRPLVDLCMMASKLVYENPKVIRNVVLHQWKMHFVEFINGWNDFQKERSTQVFILCDKLVDANLILISFRGTEPFGADDWITDFDYSWYEIPKLGKVHMGFLEALGLGNRTEVSTFKNHLQVGRYNLNNTMQHLIQNLDVTAHLSKGTESVPHSDSVGQVYPSFPEGPTSKKEFLPEMAEMTAYYSVRSKLKSLLDEHKNAKFIVTGHSLGGALAILFPTVLVLHEEKEIMQRLLGVYTFGQPRVGDSNFGSFMEAHLNHPTPKYFRVVYCSDLVPRLPYDDSTFLYKHFGLCLYYDINYFEQKLDEEPNKNYFGLRYLIPEHLNACWELIRGLTMGYTHGEDYKEGWFSILLRVLGLALPGISAHCPTNYINSVRLRRECVHMPSI